MTTQHKDKLTPEQEEILSGIPEVPQRTFAAMAMQQNELTEQPLLAYAESGGFHQRPSPIL
jgi:hypothetical protein